MADEKSSRIWDLGFGIWGKAKYSSAPGVGWVVERTGLILLDDSGRSEKVDYPNAAVWDLASRGYRHAKIVEMVSHIAGVDLDESRRIVTEALDGWVAAGFLVRQEAGGWRPEGDLRSSL